MNRALLLPTLMLIFCASFSTASNVQASDAQNEEPQPEPEGTDSFSACFYRWFRHELGALGVPNHDPNFHVVNDGTHQDEVCVRSCQLTEDALRAYIEEYSLTIIINLRGQHEGEGWYDMEARVARELGIELINIEWQGAHTRLDPEVFGHMIDTLLTSGNKLLHCKAGRDRTSLAAALYCLLVMDTELKEALKQTAFVPYTHIAYLYPAVRQLVELVHCWRQEEQNRDGMVKAYREMLEAGEISPCPLIVSFPMAIKDKFRRTGN